MSTRFAVAGKPTVESPGPSLPALVTKTTLGLAARTESIAASMRAVPSRSLPTPKLRLSTSGRLRVLAKRMAYSMPRSMLPVTVTPP